MNAFDGLWAAVLDEENSTDDASYDTSSTGRFSATSSSKQVRWLLPNRQSSSSEDDTVDWWGRRQPSPPASPKQKRSFRKRNSKKANKKKEENQKNDSTFWSQFAAEEDDASKGKAQVQTRKDDDSFWSSTFGFFDDDNTDDRSDKPTRSALRARRRYSGSSLENENDDESRGRSPRRGIGRYSSRLRATNENDDESRGQSPRRGRGKYSSRLLPLQMGRRSSSRSDLVVAEDARDDDELDVSITESTDIDSDEASQDNSIKEKTRTTQEDTATMDDAKSKDTRTDQSSEASSKRSKMLRCSQGSKLSDDSTTFQGSSITTSTKTSKDSLSKGKIFGVLDLVICKSRKHSDYEGQTFDDRELREEASRGGEGQVSRYTQVRFFTDGKEVSDGEVHRLNVSNKPGEGQSWMSMLNNKDTSLPPESPISMHLYEDDQGPSIGVAYDYFGSGLQLRTYTRPPTPGHGEILIKVEASTVSYSDCIIHRGGWWKQEQVPLPNTPGVDVVGVVRQVHKRGTSKWHIRPGDRVTAFCKWGGNARYAVVRADTAVPVRDKKVDPAAVACLADTYLSAFQALHIANGANVRYGSDSLQGKSILVIGALGAVGKAIVELAFAAGSTEVYATAKSKHHESLKASGVRPLDRDVSTWIYQYRGRMDLVLVADCDACDPDIFKALSLEGQFVFVGRRVSLAQSQWLKEDKARVLACVRDKSSLMKRTHAYDVFESWERNANRCKHDLGHLLMLLSTNTIHPHIVDRVPLEKIAQAHKLLLESKRIPGVYVCEPWVKSKRRAVYM